MLDNGSAYSRLDSTLYGALIHALEVTGPCIQADLAAGRVFGTTSKAVDVYVGAFGLDLSPDQLADLHNWPRDEGSVFDYASKGNIRDRIFRPEDMVNVLQFSRQRFYTRIEAHTKVRDAICLSFVLTGAAWVMFTFLRCGDSLPFNNSQIDVLKRFKPLLGRLVLVGYQGDIRVQGHVATSQGSQGQVRHPSIAELFAKLSKTERNVLDHLRMNKSERNIAALLNRSPNTVHVHVKNIYRKLDISSRKQLIDLFAGS